MGGDVHDRRRGLFHLLHQWLIAKQLQTDLGPLEHPNIVPPRGQSIASVSAGRGGNSWNMLTRKFRRLDTSITSATSLAGGFH